AGMARVQPIIGLGLPIIGLGQPIIGVGKSGSTPPSALRTRNVRGRRWPGSRGPAGQVTGARPSTAGRTDGVWHRRSAGTGANSGNGGVHTPNGGGTSPSAARSGAGPGACGGSPLRHTRGPREVPGEFNGRGVGRRN